MSSTDRLFDYLDAWETAFRAGVDRPPEDFAPDAPELWDDLRQRVAERRRVLALLTAETAESPGGPPTVSLAGSGQTADLADVLRHVRPPAGPDELGRLGDYRLLQLVGRGGMGAVFAAEDVRLRRPVAVKVMLPAQAGRPGARERFLLEARAAAGVRSDHVVTIHFVGEEAGVPYFAMEYLRGRSLEDRLTAGEPIPVAEALRIGREAALGLQAAHERGLVHRDIKPGNLWLEDPAGRVKILDFGLVRSAEEDTRLTNTGAVLGTPAYMSPEQARGEEAGPRSDLFSLGAVLYRLLTGSRPFPGATAVAVAMSLGADEPVAVRTRNSAVPPAVADTVHRLLAKDPALRFASARDVADALRDHERENQAPAAAPASATPPRRPRRRAVLAGVAALAAIALAIILMRPSAGTVTVRTGGDGVRLVLKRDGVPVRTVSADGPVELPAGSYTVEFAGVEAEDGFRLDRDRLDVSRGGEAALAVTRDPPPAGSFALPAAAFLSEVHGVTEEELKRWAAGLPPGYRPDWISARIGADPVVFDALARPVAASFAWELTTPGEAEDWDRMSPTHRLDFTVHYAGPAGTRRVYVWVKGDRTPWSGGVGTATHILASADKSARDGLRPRSLTGEPAPGGALHGLLVRADAGPRWEIELDLSAEDLARSVAARRGRGWRPEFAAVFGGPAPRYQACFAEDKPPRRWDYAADLTPAGYEKRLRENLARGLQPACVTSVVTAGRVRYNVLWDDRPDRPRPESNRFPAANPPVADFREAHGLTEDGMRAWVAGLPTGFRLDWLAARNAPGPPAFDVVAVADGGPAKWELDVIPQSEGDANWKARIGAGFRYVRDAHYADAQGGPKMAQLWANDGRPFLLAVGDARVIGDALAKARREGDVPTHVSAAHRDGGRGQFAFFTASPGLRWEVEDAVAPDDLAAAFRRQRDRGFRPIAVTADHNAAPPRLTAVFVANWPGAAWDVSANVSPAAYAKELDARAARKMRPLCVCSYTHNGEVAYTAVWVEFGAK